MVFIWIVGANLIYYSEYLYHKDGKVWINTSFQSYGLSYWDVVVYLTSGVEDYVPDGPISKTISFFLLISGITIVGIFTANLAAILIRIFNEKKFVKLMPAHMRFKKHIVICGNNKKLDGILSQLSYSSRKNKRAIIIISSDIDKKRIKDKKKYKNVWGIVGDPSQSKFLTIANAEMAHATIVLTNENNNYSPVLLDAKAITNILNLFNTHTISEILCPESIMHFNKLQDTHSNEVIDSNKYSAHLIAQCALTNDLSYVYDELLNFSNISNEIYFINTYKHDLIGKSYNEIICSENEDFIIIGYQVKNAIDGFAQNKTQSKIIINPKNTNEKYNKNYKLTDHDKLIVIGYEKKEIKINLEAKNNYKTNNINLLEKNDMEISDQYSKAKKNEKLAKKDCAETSNFHDHIIICNWSNKAEQIIRELHADNVHNPKSIILITDKPEEVSQSTENWMKEVFVIPGSPLDSEVLKKASLDKASTAIILSDPRDKEYADSKVIIIALAIEAINKNIHTIVEVIESEHKTHFLNTHVDEIICIRELTEKIMAQSALTNNISQLYLHLLSQTAETNEIYILPVPTAFIGKKYLKLEKYLRTYDKEDIILIGFITKEKYVVKNITIHNHYGNEIEKDKLYLNPRLDPKDGKKGKDYKLNEGDKIVVIGYHKPKIS